MSRTLGTLALGTSVWIDEYIDGVQTPTEYIVVEHASATQLLRKEGAVQKRMHSSNIATYDGCEADTYFLAEDGFRARFDAPTLAALESTVITPKGIDGNPYEIARDIYVPTEGNVGASTDEGTSWLPVLKDIAGTTLENTARICYNNAGSVVNWWLSSAYSEAQFSNVNTRGGVHSIGASYANNWMRPALSVASATIVSPEGEDTIYLLPDAAKTYREVSGTIIIGESAARPKSARLLIETENMTESAFAISNNAGDKSPAWVDVDPGSTVGLTNIVKETVNWVIGVKMYGKSNGRGKIHEPVVLAELEE